MTDRHVVPGATLLAMLTLPPAGLAGQKPGNTAVSAEKGRAALDVLA